MFNKYIIISGIALVIMLVINLVAVGTAALDFWFGAGVFFAALYLTFPFYRDKIRSWIAKVDKEILFVASVITNLIFIGYIVILIVNLPKTKPYEEKIHILSPSPPTEEAAYMTQIERFDKKEDKVGMECYPAGMEWINNRYDGSDAELEEIILSEDCQAKRTKVLKFYRENVLSFPLSKYEPHQYISAPMPKFMHIDRLFKNELTDVAMQLYHGDLETAQQKYIQLWEAVDKMMSGKNGLFFCVITNSTLEKLTNFYTVYGSDLKLHENQEFLTILNDVIPKMDTSLQDALRIEYLTMKGVMTAFSDGQIANIGLIETPLTTSERFRNHLIAPAGRWPLFDKYKTMGVFHDLHHEFIVQTGMPAYQADYDKIIKRSEDVLQSVSGTKLENPTGKIFLSLAIPNYSKILTRKEKLKSKVIAIKYLVSVDDPNNPDDIPMDNMTGETFDVSYDGGILKITGAEVDLEMAR